MVSALRPLKPFGKAEKTAGKGVTRVGPAPRRNREVSHENCDYPRPNASSDCASDLTVRPITERKRPGKSERPAVFSDNNIVRRA